MTRRPSPRHDDRGTSLILAIVFVFVIGMVLVAVGGLAANALLNTNNARAERTSTGDGENAVTIAMQYLRYNPISTAPAPSCLPPSSTVPSSDPRVGAVNPLRVDCTVAVNPTSSRTRVVDFYACPSGTTPLSACQSAAVLHAEVAYNDLNADGVDDCFNVGSVVVTTSCGGAMNIDLWDVTGADN